MRSDLFTPGGSEKMLDKGLQSEADVLLIDLEDAIAPDAKDAARETAAGFWQGLDRTDKTPPLYVRINDLESGLADADLEYLAENQSEIRTGDASAFSVPDKNGIERAVMMVQCRESHENKRADLKDRLNSLVREEFGIDCQIELVPRNTLPRTTSGKLSRSGARKEYLKRVAAEHSKRPDEDLYAARLRQRAV